MMIQKILIALLIGLAGFLVWFIGLWFLASSDWLGLLWTGLVLIGIWLFTRKIFKNFYAKVEED